MFKHGSSSRQTTLKAFRILFVQRTFLILLVESCARTIIFPHCQSFPLTKLLFKVFGLLNALYVFGDSRFLATIRLNSCKILTLGAHRNSGNKWNDSSCWLVSFAGNSWKCCFGVCHWKYPEIRNNGILVECKVPILVYTHLSLDRLVARLINSCKPSSGRFGLIVLLGKKGW